MPTVVEFSDNGMCIILSPLELSSREEVAVAAPRFAEWDMYVYACHKSATKVQQIMHIRKQCENFLLPKLFKISGGYLSLSPLAVLASGMLLN